MKRLFINIIAVFVIGAGSIFLTASSHADLGTYYLTECSSWKLSCDGERCCSICEDNGQIGDCVIMVEEIEYP